MVLQRDSGEIILRGRIGRVLGFLKLRQVWIRIIYITEELQYVTLYCCSTKISGRAGWGCLFAKWLQRNETQKFSVARLTRLVSFPVGQGAV